MPKTSQEKVEKPRVFIGSSVESLSIANFIHLSLEHNAEPTVWTQGIFAPSSNTLDDLIENLDNFDFAVFVFSPDDISKIRGKKYSVARDNVIFEMGLFIGRLGKKRVFYIIPRHRDEFHLPSDLIGVTPLDYDNKRSDGNIQAALGSPCTKINGQIDKLGRLEKKFTNNTLEASSDSSIFSAQEEKEFHYIFNKLNKTFYCRDYLYKKEIVDGKADTKSVGSVNFECSLIKQVILSVRSGYTNFEYFLYSLEDIGNLLIKDDLGDDYSLGSNFQLLENITPAFMIVGLLDRTIRYAHNRDAIVYEYSQKLFRFISWLEYNNLDSTEDLIISFELITKDN